MVNSQTYLPAASGFRQLAAITHPIFAEKLIQRFSAQSVTGNITHSDIIPAKLKSCGNQVVFTLPPEARVFSYQKNQVLEHDELNLKRVTMTVNRALYWNLVLDRVDEKQICDLQTWVNEYQKRATLNISLKIDREILTELPSVADPFNKGSCAGRITGAYDLGKTGSPVVLNGANILTKIMQCAQVLDEANIPPSDRFIVLPSVAKAAFMNNQILANAYASGMSKSILIDGSVPDVLGFTIYFSNNFPVYTDQNRPTYAVLFGSKKATGFITQIADMQKIDQDPQSFSRYIRYLNVYDFMVLNPELLGVLYATFEVA